MQVNSKIMRNFLLSLILIVPFSTLNVFSQRKDTDAKISISNFVNAAKGNRKQIGQANLRIRYAFNALDIKDKNTWIDEGQLKISPEMTDYSSYFIEVNEDSLMNWFNIHGSHVAYPATRWLQGYNPDYWIEYQYSQITTKDSIVTEWATMPRELDSENLYYSEKTPLMIWTISNNVDTICGYECIEAVTRWRGREYIAWFTPDIPIKSGPWKFGGLPGLIMKIADNKNIYSFEAVAVETGDFPIYAPRGNNYKLQERDKVWKLQKALNENYLKSTGHSLFNLKLNQSIDSRIHPYSQLELE